jgi:restriction endonuclease S subunit
MEEWKKYRLGEICSRICSGGTPSSRHDEYYGGNIPWLNTKEIDFKPIFNTEKKITKEGLENSSAKWVEKDSIIVAMYGATAGKTAITKIPLTTNQACCNLTINSTVADYRFVYYSLANKFNELSLLANGGAQQNLNAQIIKNFVISLPEISTQKFIANILSSLDDKIELNRKINSNLEEQAKALYSKYASLAIGTARIGDLANEVLDYTPCTYPRVYLLNSSDISEGIFPKIELVDNKDLKGHFKKRFRFGDILYSQIRPRNHHYGLVLFEADRYISSTRLMIIRTKKEQISEYLLYQAIISPCVCDEFTLKTETRSGTFPQGNYKDMANIIIPYGTKEQREKIEPKLKVLRKAIYSYQKENVILSSIRDALLPKLMSGEIEVK